MDANSNDREGVRNFITSSGDVAKYVVSRAGLPRDSLKHHTPVIILINVRGTDTSTSSPQSEHNYLKQFRKIYEEKGWITIQCTPTEDRINRGEADEVTRTLFSCMQNRNLTKNPMILHVVGHTGLPVHNAICQYVMDERDLGNFITITGCILDSCPKQPNGLMGKFRDIWPGAYDCLILIIYFIKLVYPELFDQCTSVNDYDKFCYCPSLWPQLYLYSTTDHIAPRSGIEKAISLLRNAGVAIETKFWNDTEHARHVFAHEQEYTQLCQQFVLASLGRR